MDKTVSNSNSNLQSSDTISVPEKFSAPYAGMPDFDDVLMSRIEKADKRIGIISVEECMNSVREEMARRWNERHAV
jgi:hypothetical protein